MLDFFFKTGTIEFSGDLKTCFNKYIHETATEKVVKLDSKNEKAYIQEISISESKPFYDVIDELEFNIKLQVIFDKIAVCMAVYIRNDFGDVILFTRDIESIDSPIRNKGNYVYSFKIPNKFLSPGHYSLSVDLAELNSDKLQSLSDVISFEVKDHHSVRSKLGLGWFGNNFFFPEWSVK